MPDKITLSEALGWQKTLATRHGELVNLRNQNANSTKSYYGQNDRERITEPKYDVIALDRLIAMLSRERRLLDEAIKRMNAQTVLDGYLRNDDVLGELTAPTASASEDV